MADPFEKDELLLDDEWVELCDLEGNRASFRHLATIGIHQNTYMILGAAFDEMDEPRALMLIREDAKGKREIITLNLNDANLITSDHYYLQQNDILYVSPNKTKAKNSDIGQSTSLWFSATSILVSIASLLVTIFR